MHEKSPAGHVTGRARQREADARPVASVMAGVMHLAVMGHSGVRHTMPRHAAPEMAAHSGCRRVS